MTRVDGYTVLSKAGAGGLADVWVAEVALSGAPRCPTLLPGDRVALKVLRDPERSEASRRRFLREGRLLRELRHPSLPRCHDVIDGPQPVLVLELLEGRTLRDWIRDAKQLSAQDALSLAEHLLRALTFLHERGVVHRDVKPANIFYTDDQRVLLLDLGLAADPSEPPEQVIGDVMGTYAYMAPEQIAGAALDHRADLYSLGVTLYEAIAGRRPFRASGPAGYLKAHTAGGAPPVSASRRDRIPTRLEELVGRLMARDPAARPQTARIALAVLTGFQGARRSLLRPPVVGREAAIGAISAVLDACGALQLVGEPGMGQSRLARLAWNRAKELNFDVICLRGGPGVDPLTPEARLRRIIARRLGPPGPGWDGLTEALQERVASRRTLLLVEDIDRVEAGEAERIFGLAKLSGICLITTAERALAAAPGTILPLRALEVDEVRTLLCGMLGTPSIPGGLADKLHRFSGGAPAIVTLTTRDFVDRGVLSVRGVGDEGETSWQLTASLRMTPDNSLNLLYAARLQRLDPQSRALLEVLAVARDELPRGVALAAAGAREPSSEAFVDILTADHLATARESMGERWLRVRHPALGALVTAGLEEGRTRLIHAALAEAIAAAPPSRWRDDQLPLFRALAASAEQAGRAQARVAEWLYARGRTSHALEVVTRAAHEPGLGAATATRCALLRGRALLTLGRPGEAAASINAALQLARDQQATAPLAQGLALSAELRLYRGEVRRALDEAEESGRLADPLPEAEVSSWSRLLIGRCHTLLGDREQAADALGRCVTQGVTGMGREHAAIAQGYLGRLYADAGRLDEAIRCVSQEVAFLRARQRRDASIGALHRLVVLKVRAGALAEAEALAEEAQELATSVALPHVAAIAAMARAELLLACGDFDAANTVLKGYPAAGEEDAPVELRTAWRALRVEVRLGMADHNAALAACNQIVQEATRVGWSAMRAYHAGLIAVLRAHAEPLAEALDALFVVGDRRSNARLLLAAARISGDAAALDAALAEARAAGDRLLLLDALHACGGAAQQAEAGALVMGLFAGADRGLADRLRRRDAVRWAIGAR